MPKKVDMNWLDHPAVLAVTFHPRREAGPAGDDPGYEPLAVPVAPGVTVGGRFYRAGADKPTLLFFHGNGEIVADYDDLAPLYIAMGINFAPVDYRGYGQSTGSPTIGTMLADARAIFEFVSRRLAEQGYTNRIVVMGRSLGSASALELAAAYPDKLAGLIIESGFADTAGLLARLGAPVPAGGLADDVVRQAEKIKAFAGPTLIIHGTADVIIPLADAEALHAASGSRAKTLLRVRGAGHNNLLAVGYDAYMRAVAELAGTAGRRE